MSIFDTFTILFKSNADGVEKDMNKAGKATEDFQKKINEADKTTSSLAGNLLEIAAAGVAGFATFEGLKSGISDAHEMNTALARMSIVTGESSQELAAWDAAFARLSGNKGEFLNWYQSTAQLASANGRSAEIPNILPNLRDLSKKLHGENIDQARADFGQFHNANGLPWSTFGTLREGGDALDALLEKEREQTKVTQKGADANLKWSQSWDDVKTSMGGVFTNMTKYLSGKSGNALDFVNDIIKDWSSVTDKDDKDQHFMSGIIPYGMMSNGNKKDDEFLGKVDVDSSKGINLGGSEEDLGSFDDTKISDMFNGDTFRKAMGMKALTVGKQKLKDADDSAGFIPFTDAHPYPERKPDPALRVNQLIINTEASDSEAIAKEIKGALQKEYGAAKGNFDDSGDK